MFQKPILTDEIWLDSCLSALALFFVACKGESSFTYLNSVGSEKLQSDFDPALLELKQSLMIPQCQWLFALQELDWKLQYILISQF